MSLLKKIIITMLLLVATIISSLSISLAETNNTNMTELNPQVKADAEKLGINTDGLTTLQVKDLITAKNFLKWRDIAAEYKIDVTGMTDIEVMNSVQIYESKLKTTEKKISGIETIITTNISDELIKSLIICPEVITEALRRGINYDGLTNLQVKNKISEQVFAENREKAKQYNIDITGLSDIDVCVKVNQFEQSASFKKFKNIEAPLDLSKNAGVTVIIPDNNSSLKE